MDVETSKLQYPSNSDAETLMHQTSNPGAISDPMPLSNNPSHPHAVHVHSSIDPAGNKANLNPDNRDWAMMSCANLDASRVERFFPRISQEISPIRPLANLADQQPTTADFAPELLPTMVAGTSAVFVYV
ncbi:hypothetical protein Bbelb_250160 [Branchiostoma belcheri]|nr:hypothetical protein Bbelb_250160 [Branchiostoma belcheri]